MIPLSIIIVLILIVKIRFRPRIEVTVNKDVLLFYNVYTFGIKRSYINLHIKL